MTVDDLIAQLQAVKAAHGPSSGTLPVILDTIDEFGFEPDRTVADVTVVNGVVVTLECDTYQPWEVPA